MAFSDEDWERNPTLEHLKVTMARMAERGELVIIWELDEETGELEWRYCSPEQAPTLH